MQYIELSLETTVELGTAAIHVQNAISEAHEFESPEKCNAAITDVVRSNKASQTN